MALKYCQTLNCGGFSDDPEAKFCSWCGMPFERREPARPPRTIMCNGCGKETSPNSKYCPYCGNDLMRNRGIAD
ncbi:MAG: zinc ribbon domain-containing protein [Candidatus Nealsonbacteria bacterium]|nr:zinc ribbon domain-containing protein [Candidatus Nealsonbacteria bacterium]